MALAAAVLMAEKQANITGNCLSTIIGSHAY